jgi:hypothetical protein
MPVNPSCELIHRENPKTRKLDGGGMAIAIEPCGAYRDSADTVKVTAVATTVPATDILEVARFPRQELEELTHFWFVQNQPSSATHADAHAAIIVLVLAGHDCEFELTAGSHRSLLGQKSRTKNLRPSPFQDDGLFGSAFLGYIIRWLLAESAEQGAEAD